MCFFRYGLLAVPLLAAFAAEPPRYLQGVPAQATDLHWAALEGDVAEVKRLLAAGADVDATETVHGGERALHWAAHGGGSGVVRALIAAGASLEAQDADGETALFNAVRSQSDGNYFALMALLSAGADPNARRGESESGSLSLLHVAVQGAGANRAFVVNLLRRFGADPNVTNRWGRTPLHYTAAEPYDRFLGEALHLGLALGNELALDVNARDSYGETPLHWVAGASLASAGDPEVMLWLLRHGAGVNAVGNDGRTPLDWAEFASEFASGTDEGHRFSALATILRNRGGVKGVP